MSYSFRTQPDWIIARDRVFRRRDGTMLAPWITERNALPRIVGRKPPRGDFHPLTVTILHRIFRRLPLQYTHGLRCVELMPRRGSDIGAPFGDYTPREKKIRLYSVPEKQWIFHDLTSAFKRLLESYDAKITDSSGQTVVEWRTAYDIELLYVYEVLYHELGHHYVHQHRCKRKVPSTRGTNEFLADWHSRKLAKRIFRRIARASAEKAGR